MGTDKMVWSVTLDGKCCERPQVTPDGKIVVVGGDLQDYWYEVDARTGRLIGKLEAPESPNSHNLNLSADGKTAFMSPNNKVLTISDVKSRKVIKTIRFPDNVRVFVLNKDSTRIYANNNNFLGFLIGEDFGAHRVEPQRPGDGLGRRAIIAGDHDHAQAFVAQVADGGGR